MRVRLVVASVLALLTRSEISQCQQQTFELLCDKMRSGACAYGMAAGDSVSLTFWVRRDDIHAPMSGVKVTFFPSAGTTNPVVAVSDPLGQVTTWFTPPKKPKGVSGILALAEAGGRAAAQTDTITWTTSAVTLTLARLSPRTIRVMAGDVVRDSVIVELLGLNPADEKAAEKCQAANVLFRQTLAATKPDTIRARFTPYRSKRTDPLLRRCIAGYRWQTPQAPGNQEIRAELVGGISPSTSPMGGSDVYADTRVVADAPAHILIGFAGTGKTIRVPEDQDQGLKKALQTVIGVDFSVPSLLPTFDKFDALDNLRLLVVTNTAKIGKDLYVGAELAPLFEGPAAMTIPAQAALGFRHVQGLKRRYFPALILSYNATSVIGNLLGPLGFPK
jgi:hypothetical protein